MARRPLTVPTSGTVANALDYGDTPTPLAVWVTPDGVVVGGPGAWQQLSSLLPQAYAANWAVPDWYIDGVVGLDTNNGTTALTPLRTGAELLRRLGPYALWGQSVTVHVLANGMTDALILRGVMLVAGTHLDVIGTPTQLADAGTVASYTGIVHATPAAPQVSTTLIADWTTHQFRRLRITAGAVASVGAVTWVAVANPAGAGLNIARTPRWSRPKPATFPIYELVNPAIGDAVVVESLPAIPALTLQVDGPLLLPGNPAFDHRQWFISSVDCQNVETAGTALGEISYALIFGSRLAQVRALPRLFTQITSLAKLGCYYRQDDTSSAIAAVVNTEGTLYACLFGGGATVQAVSGASQVVSLNSCLGQGCGFTANAYGYFAATDCQVFDLTSATSSAFVASSLAIANVPNFSGANNAGFGYSVSNNCTLRLFGTQNISGAVSPARLSAGVAVNLSIAQLLQPSDYAQKGRAQLVPGVPSQVTVNVPWWDPATQRVTVSYSDLAGGFGTLLTPTAAQTNTQFVIESTDPADGSTVNWAISPLGRNIFISTT